jgi:phage shock protein A
MNIEVQDLINELTSQRNMAMDSVAQLNCALKAAQAKIAELEAPKAVTEAVPASDAP